MSAPQKSWTSGRLWDNVQRLFLDARIALNELPKWEKPFHVFWLLGPFFAVGGPPTAKNPKFWYGKKPPISKNAKNRKIENPVWQDFEPIFWGVKIWALKKGGHFWGSKKTPKIPPFFGPKNDPFFDPFFGAKKSTKKRTKKWVFLTPFLMIFCNNFLIIKKMIKNL